MMEPSTVIIFSASKVAGQIYHKINLVVHPTHTLEDDFEPHLYNHMYFLDPMKLLQDTFYTKYEFCFKI